MLGRSSLLAHLGPEAVARMAEASRPLSLARGDVVFEQGDEADCLYLVCTGRVSIAKRSADGRSSVMAIMEEEDLFGELPLFDGRERSAQAKALEPSTLLCLPYEALRQELKDNPSALWGVVSLLTERLRATNEALADSMFLDVTGRTAKRILELAGDADDFVIPVTQEELATIVGASRERVNKAISTFCRLGWLRQDDRHYRITDRAKLAQRAL